MSIGSRVKLFLLSLGAAGAMMAEDVYVVRFDSPLVLVEAPCTYLSYRDDLIFYNPGTSDAVVELVDVSNGEAADPEPLTVEAGTVRSSLAESTATATWVPEPRPQSGLWVARLSLPSDVQVTSRLLTTSTAYASCNDPFPTLGLTRDHAGLAMPVVRNLTPPGVPRVHLGTDIGGRPTLGSEDGRTNIGIFNAGTSTAHATAALHRACDGRALETRAATIEPNTITQLSGFSAAFADCDSRSRAALYETYVVVTVDQPSLSYVITLSNQGPPWIAATSSP